MARAPATFRQSDVARAIKGATTAGIAVGRVEIARDGRIVVIAATEIAPEPSDHFGQWKAKRNARPS